MSQQPTYKVIFYNQGQIFEIYARQIYQSDLYGFIEIEEVLFGERSQMLVDPSEEKLKSEFEGVKRSYLPMHSIVRIDEVTKKGSAKSQRLKVMLPPSLCPPSHQRAHQISLMHPTYHSLRTPDKVVFAASDGSQTITYAGLEAESNQTAHLLRDLGLNQGDGIAILLIMTRAF